MNWQSQERVIPGMNAPPEMEAAHIARYQFAAEALPGRLVLDCGCGAGYGAAMLAETGMEVIAGDLAPDAVVEAARDYPTPRYVVFNAEQLPFADGVFDAATCFEVIEHVQDPDRLCVELARVLKPEGTVLLSTPPAHSPYESNPNPFHLQLYTAETLAGQLEAHFDEVRILGQCPPFDLRRCATVHPVNRLVIWLKRVTGIRRKLLRQATWASLFRRISPGPEWTVRAEDFTFEDDRLENALTMIAVCRKAP